MRPEILCRCCQNRCFPTEEASLLACPHCQEPLEDKDVLGVTQPYEGPAEIHSSEELLAEQHRCCEQREDFAAERFFARYPTLTSTAEIRLDLICNELLLRRQAGETPDLSEYLKRFPQFDTAIRKQFQREPGSRITDQFDETRPTSAIRDSGAQTLVPRTTSTLAIPSIAGRYQIVEEIASGGMGAVLRARDPVLGRTLAVKIMLPHTMMNEEAQARFAEEARITGQLQHPGIPPVHDLGTLENGCPFFAMKLIEGRTLASLIKERRQTSPGPTDSSTTPSDLPRFLSVFGQICQTLAYAHSQGIIHRDLKPHNVMVGEFSEVQVMDWGLAKVLAQPETSNPHRGEASVNLDSGDTVDRGLTHTGQTMGTPAYMAPEQAQGEIHSLDARCDVFALGAILYEILVGERLHQASAVENVMMQPYHVRLAAAFEHLDQSGESPELLALTKRCLAINKEDRPAHAGEVAEAMERYEEEMRQRLRRAELEKAQAEVQAVEDRRRRQVEEAKALSERRRRKMQLALSLVILVALLLGAIGATWSLFQVNQARLKAVAAQQSEKKRAEGEERAKQSAVKARKVAELERDDAFRSAYLADMRVAQEDWSSGQVTRLLELLVRYLPQEDKPDVRGWEWYYLLAQCHQEKILFRGHQSAVQDLAWSSSGEQLASTDQEGAVILWDVKKGKKLFKLAKKGQWCDWSPTGNRLATVGSDHQVRIWDVSSGRQVSQFDGGTNSVNEIAWHPDGKQLACTSSPIRIWRSVSQKKPDRIPVLDNEEGDASKIVWSPDGKRFAYVSGDRFPIIQWDLETGIQSKAVPLPDKERWTKLSSSSDGKQLTDGYDCIIIRDQTGENARRIALTGETHDVCWSPDGNRLAIAKGDSTTEIWDLQTNKKTLTLPHASTVLSVSWSPDGTKIATGARGQKIYLWDAERGEKLNVIQGHLGWVVKVAWSPDSRHLASAGIDGTVRVWDTKSLSQTSVLQDPTTASFDSPDGARRVIRRKGKSIVLDLKTNQELCRFHDKSPRNYDWIKGTNLLLTYPKSRIDVRDSSTGNVLWSIQKQGHQGEGVKTKDNSVVVLSRHAWLPNDTQVWDLTTGKLLHQFIGHTSNVLAMSISHDDRKLATGSIAGDIKIWNLRTGELLQTLYGHVPGHWVGALAWGHQHELLASGGWDQTVKVWNVRQGKLLHSLEGHTSAITGVCFAPDNSRLLTVSSNGAVKIWDVKSGRELLNLAMPQLTKSDYRIHWNGQEVTIDRNNNESWKLDASRGYELAKVASPGEIIQIVRRTLVNDQLLKWVATRDSNILARNLIVDVRAEYYNPKIALGSAEHLVKLSPNNGRYWNLVAILRYRNKDFQGVLDAAQRSEDLLKGQHYSYNGFFLSMAHAKLGHPDKARKLFDRAKRWMEKNASGDKELQLYQKEARGLLR